MTDLLNIDGNPKTVKGQKLGYMTAIMYLAPYKASGRNLCPFAEIAGCWKTCLNVQGHGGMAKDNARFNPYGVELPDNVIQRARLWRTRLWNEDRTAFFIYLIDEITKFIAKAKRKGLVPVVRLNGTSDIEWERVLLPWDKGKTIFDVFPDTQFYDYTKIPNRFNRGKLPKNYHLTLSYSEHSAAFANSALEEHDFNNASLAVVVRDQSVKDEFLARGAIDFDVHDLRFLDPPGSVGVLKAKGSARKETNGFVLNDGGLLSGYTAFGRRSP